MNSLRADTFFLLNERLPHFGKDPFPPWRYWGWLCMLVKLIHIDPDFRRVSNRWGYLIETRKTGRLLEHPIPTIDFQYNAAAMKHLEALVQVLEGPYRTWESFSLLVDWLAWGCGVTDSYPERVTDELAEALYRLLNIELWLSHPFDYLGHMIEVVTGTGCNPNGFFPTPVDVVRVMLRAQLGADPGDLRDKTFYDCSVGTGRTLLEASNYSLRLYGQDIDPFVVKICLINGCFYAPWMLDPLPDSFWGDSVLDREIQRLADLEKVQSEVKASLPVHEPVVLPVGGVLSNAPTHQVTARGKRAKDVQSLQQSLFQFKEGR